MSREARRVEITCPKCGRRIATAPEDDLPQGPLVCPGCGARVRAPGKADLLIEEAKQTIKHIAEEVVEPFEKEKKSD